MNRQEILLKHYCSERPQLPFEERQVLRKCNRPVLARGFLFVYETQLFVECGHQLRAKVAFLLFFFLLLSFGVDYGLHHHQPINRDAELFVDVGVDKVLNY